MLLLESSSSKTLSQACLDLEEPKDVATFASSVARPNFAYLNALAGCNLSAGRTITYLLPKLRGSQLLNTTRRLSPNQSSLVFLLLLPPQSTTTTTTPTKAQKLSFRSSSPLAPLAETE